MRKPKEPVTKIMKRTVDYEILRDADGIFYTSVRSPLGRIAYRRIENEQKIQLLERIYKK